MKIKLAPITNSSSTSFIISKNKETEDIAKIVIEDEIDLGYYAVERITDLKTLQELCEDYDLSKEEKLLCEKEVESGKEVLFCVANSEDCSGPSIFITEYGIGLDESKFKIIRKGGRLS
jgi:hypothetical protein